MKNLDQQLSKLTSPDELDKRLVVVKPRGWIALLLTTALVIGSLFWAFFGRISNTYDSQAIYLNTEGFEAITAPVEGRVSKVFITSGEEVEAQTPLAEINQTEILKGEESGKVIEIFKQEGEKVEVGERLVLIEKKSGTYHFYTFVPLDQSQNIKLGMDVFLYPQADNLKRYGPLYGKVSTLSPFVISEDRLIHLLGVHSLLPYFTKKRPVVEVEITPTIEDGSLKWRDGEGPSQLKPQSMARAMIILHSKKPIDYILPGRAES